MKLARAALFSLLPFAAFAQQELQAPKQPIEFNHKLHVTDLKLQCKMCHPNPEPGEMMGLPEAATCMRCHAGIQPKTPAERKLTAFAKQNRDIDWIRVYQIPTYVRFDHRQHVQAGVRCETCHGPVGERRFVRRERDMSMGSCMNCHRQAHASLDCGSCHDPR